jgi:uncharacterized OB-fold protein
VNDIVVARDAFSAPFYDGAAAGQLMLRGCARCDRRWAPATRSCTACGAELEWVRGRPAGVIVSWTIDPAGPEPVISAVVELEDGPWLPGRLADAPPELVSGKLAVVVTFEYPNRQGLGERVPVFRPRD